MKVCVIIGGDHDDCCNGRVNAINYTYLAKNLSNDVTLNLICITLIKGLLTRFSSLEMSSRNGGGGGEGLLVLAQWPRVRLCIYQIS